MPSRICVVQSPCQYPRLPTNRPPSDAPLGLQRPSAEEVKTRRPGRTKRRPLLRRLLLLQQRSLFAVPWSAAVAGRLEAFASRSESTEFRSTQWLLCQARTSQFRRWSRLRALIQFNVERAAPYSATIAVSASFSSDQSNFCPRRPPKSTQVYWTFIGRTREPENLTY